MNNRILYLCLLLLLIIEQPVLQAQTQETFEDSSCLSTPSAIFNSNTSVTVSSNKELSNVIIRFCDDTEIKYDNLSGYTKTYSTQKPITTVFIKSGCNSTVNGLGQQFTNPNSNVCATPTPTPTRTPSKTPTKSPTSTPTAVSTNTPTVCAPSATPTKVPTSTPTKVPSNTPTKVVTSTPTSTPSKTPTKVSTSTPTTVPSRTPTKVVTSTPSSTPSKTPTVAITNTPTAIPSETPTTVPTSEPTIAPTVIIVQTEVPTEVPTEIPVVEPTVAGCIPEPYYTKTDVSALLSKSKILVTKTEIYSSKAESCGAPKLDYTKKSKQVWDAFKNLVDSLITEVYLCPGECVVTENKTLIRKLKKLSVKLYVDFAAPAQRAARKYCNTQGPGIAATKSDLERLQKEIQKCKNKVCADK